MLEGLPVLESTFALLIATTLCETLLSGAWSPAYFRYGIPLYSFTAGKRVLASRLPEPDAVERRLARSAFPPMLVRELDPHGYAVREAFWGRFGQVSYTPVMRGLLELGGDGRVRITGRVNWFALAFLATSVVFAFHWSGPMGFVFPGVLLALVGFIYLTQARRFRNVAETACNLCGDAR